MNIVLLNFYDTFLFGFNKKENDNKIGEDRSSKQQIHTQQILYLKKKSARNYLEQQPPKMLETQITGQSTQW